MTVPLGIYLFLAACALALALGFFTQRPRRMPEWPLWPWIGFGFISLGLAGLFLWAGFTS